MSITFHKETKKEAENHIQDYFDESLGAFSKWPVLKLVHDSYMPDTKRLYKCEIYKNNSFEANNLLASTANRYESKEYTAFLNGMLFMLNVLEALEKEGAEV